MNSYWYARIVTVLAFLLCFSAHADDYNFEVGVTIGQSEADTTTISFPAPINTAATISANADQFDLRGTWFYTGLSDNKGPKTRAAFVDRSSSVSLSYFRSDLSSTVILSGGGLPPDQSNISIDVSGYSVDLRHVWRESGWFGIISIGRAELDGILTNGPTTSTSDADSNAYSLGIGKYLADTTSVDLRVLSEESGSSTAAGISLRFSHLAPLGNTWMFGADVGITKTDTAGDGDAYNIVGSFYPNSEVDFGLSFARRDEEGGIDSESFELFAGWFISDSTRVHASYIEDTGGAGLSAEADSTGYEVGISSRF